MSLALSASANVGYTTGDGGSVTQATSKTTAVTLNNACGQVITDTAALAAAATATFTVNNSVVANTDTIVLSLKSGPATVATYRYWVDAVQTGLFKITIENRSGGSLGEALTFNFAVIKAVAS